MNIADSLRPHYVFCTAGFVPFPKTHGYAEYEDEDVSYREWSRESFTGVECGWRVNGACFGIKYNAIPRHLSPLPPSRVDVRIPDQMAWSPETWSVLDAKDSVHLSGAQIKSLGISTHLCRALSHWSSKIPNFEAQYKNLPFGSEIVVANVEADIRKMRIAFEPNHVLWDRMLSVEALKDLWRHEVVDMPPSIDYKRLKYEEQLSADVCLVSSEDAGVKRRMVFKSQTGSFSALYHEVKVLLTLARNPYVAEPPTYLVTTYRKDHKTPRVCGFLMKYYELGTLCEILPKRRYGGILSLKQQIQWAKELTSALSHIISIPGHFYSDLRMDNIVLDVDDRGSETIVLIDFEQSRNFYNWVPPEIYYMEWMAELAYEEFDWTKAVDPQTRCKYSSLLGRFLSSRGCSKRLQRPPKTYDNPPHGWYFPWLLSSQQEREASEVYLLGKALYCLFEGVADADIILGRSSPDEAAQRFPEFHRTPQPLQKLIKKCTAGAREWKDGHIKIYRRAGKVFPLGKTGQNGEPEATFEETKVAIKNFWQAEMTKAEAFMHAREKYEAGEADESHMELLDYLRRPILAEVLQALESIDSQLS